MNKNRVPRNDALDARNLEIVNDFHKGMRISDIARYRGMTRQRVHQIVHMPRYTGIQFAKLDTVDSSAQPVV